MLSLRLSLRPIRKRLVVPVVETTMAVALPVGLRVKEGRTLTHK